jgi:hypothetical protein
MITNGLQKTDMLKQLTLPNELWKEIPQTNGRYQASSLGRIATMNYKNSHQIRIMKPAKDANGYYRTMIIINGKLSTIKVHRIVAQAFIQNPLNKLEVNHINNNRDDNRISNLEWVTRRENLDHMLNQNRQSLNNGSKNGMAKLTEIQVLAIRQEYKPYVVQKQELAKKYNVSISLIKDIVGNRTWRHLL